VIVQGTDARAGLQRLVTAAWTMKGFLSNADGICILLGVSMMQTCRGQKILHNAIVYTVDPSNPYAEAIAIDENGFIVGVGNYTDIAKEYPTYELTDLGGQLVLPGFQDAHLHAVEAGIYSQVCYVDQAASIEDIPFWFDDEECANNGEFGDQGWVMGAGVDLARIVDELQWNATARYPIEVLDERWPNTPVVILDQFGHGALANTVAMEAVGYLAGPDPVGGQILRDADGLPLGIVTENAQQKLREGAFPPTEANKDVAFHSLIVALDELKKHGITTVSDAGGFWRQAQTESWARAEEEGLLTVRASNALYIYPDQDITEQLLTLMERFSNNPDKLLRFNQAKIYVDGILELSTGRLYDPYEYDPFQNYRGSSGSEWRGFEYFTNNVTLNFVVTALLTNQDWQLHFHVTGDAGAGIALSAIESLQGTNSRGPHRLTHCYLVAEADRPRFAQLGAVADFQLAPSSLSAEYRDKMTDFLGAKRAATLLPALELYEAGATVVLSSDWDADDLSPLEKIQTVLTRPDNRSFPDLETVIPLLTLNPAILLQHDDKTGSIEVGKFADLAVIDKNIFSLSFDQISTAEVSRTYLQGKLIYGGPGGSGAVVEKGNGFREQGGNLPATGEEPVVPEDEEVSKVKSAALERSTFVVAALLTSVPYYLFR
jgi:predicted amidohydrolase YtcJ